MMVYSDDAYSMALNYYNMVKEMSKRGDPEAAELYRELKTYFKRSKRATEDPTEKQVMRDAKALERGTKDGRLLIENFSPKKSGGVHKVVDETFKGKAEIKESGEVNIRE
jgi:hypothetical protein